MDKLSIALKPILLLLLTVVVMKNIHAQMVVVDDDFENVTFPFDGWTEINTSGQVTVVDGELQFDYTTVKPGAIREFDPASGIISVEFNARSTRNWIYFYVYLRNQQQDTISALVLGNAGSRNILAMTQIDDDGSMLQGVEGIQEQFNNHTDYHILFVINTIEHYASLYVDGVMLDEAEEIPLLADADSLTSMVFLNSYMFSNEGRVFIDDLKVTYYQTDKTQLSLVIGEAQNWLDNAVPGESPGQYPQEAIDSLASAIDEAVAVYENIEASAEEVSHAVENLSMAVSEFVNSVIPSFASVIIYTGQGHPLSAGFSGYNVRTSDGPWNYNHPDFREAVEFLRPGFLRYFSGTTGDYFNMNTGMMELEWFEQFASFGETSGNIPALYRWVEVKGPHRLTDLYDMLGENSARLVITYNSFTDSPENAAKLARFCKNNNIIVDYWQFTNEPNFFLPPRRYFFNDGTDYARKQREAAEAILEVDPDANLSLSYGWDGLGNFANGISNYSPVYWHTVSFHSYAVHADDPDFESAMRRANSRVVDRTNQAFYNNRVVPVSWPGAEFIITEYSTWNDYLRNLYGSIYLAEYAMRMSALPQAKMVAHHAVNLAARPAQMHTQLYLDAYDAGQTIDPDTVPTGVHYTSNAMAYNIINEALNNSDYAYQTFVSGGTAVPGMDNQNIASLYARGYQGHNGKEYLLITNKSAVNHVLDIMIDNQQVEGEMIMNYMWNFDPQATGMEINEKIVELPVTIPPYAIVRLEWDSQTIPVPKPPRIYRVDHGNGNATLRWWKREVAEGYVLKYGTQSGSYDQQINLDAHINEYTVHGLAENMQYYFAVAAINETGESGLSNEVSYLVSVPDVPLLDVVHPLSNRVKVEWESVPFADGYIVRYGNQPGQYDYEVDAKNVTGYVLRDINNNYPYYFTVVAYNGMGESEPSNEMWSIPMANIPFAPRYLHGEESGVNGTVHLQWLMSDSTHNATTNIYRSTTPWSEYELVASGIEGTSFIDSTYLTAGRYFYRVSAQNVLAESFYYSNILTVNKQMDTDDFFTEVNEWIGEDITFPGTLNPLRGERFGPLGDFQGYRFRIRVSDIMGRVIWQGNYEEYWNGYANGGIVPQGTYVWQFIAESNGKPIIKSGKVLVVY